MKKKSVLSLVVMAFFLLSCGEGLSPGIHLQSSSGQPDSGNPPGGDDKNPGGGDPSHPDDPVDPGSPPLPPGDDGGTGEPSFAPDDLPSLTMWLKASSHQGNLSSGFAVGHENSSALLNLSPFKDRTTIVHAGAPATYSRLEVSPYPSFILCGAKGPNCASSFEDIGAQLQLSTNYRSYSLLKGSDAVTPACATCSGSYTLTALVKRTTAGANILLANRNGTSTGPYLAWPTENEIFFATDGAAGSNFLKTPLGARPEGLELVTAQFSRRNGLKIYWQGELSAFDMLKNQPSSTVATDVPTLGHRAAPQSQRLHVFEYLEFRSDLLPADVCRVHTYLNESYQLGLPLPCQLDL